jgi:REP element-mobilizing transposase RayT
MQLGVMARIARVVVPEFPRHVVQLGARRMDVFFSANDRQEYLKLLSQSASQHNIAVTGSDLRKVVNQQCKIAK